MSPMVTCVATIGNLMSVKSMDDDMIRSSVCSRATLAVSFLMEGYMCSESIVLAYAAGFGLEPELAARISGGFAGGMAQGKTCGAVTGALMVIGLKFGAGLMRDQYARDLCSQMIQEFCHRFMIRRKNMECREILMMNGINPQDPREMKNLRGKKICDKIVRDAAEILEELLSGHP